MGIVGVIEDVKTGDADVQNLGMVIFGLGQFKVMVSEQVEVGCASALQGVATHAGRTGIAESSVEEI